MCAYNVRHKKTLDHDPDTGPTRLANTLRSLAIWALGIGALYFVYLLVSRYLL